jgi:hypothetical protein
MSGAFVAEGFSAAISYFPDEDLTIDFAPMAPSALLPVADSTFILRGWKGTVTILHTAQRIGDPR